ncbi:MAG: hypothetical protein QGM50_10915 [Anaerolineae bacterium]|nr:hypothetical protein [Anaerolineae bacterium]MDK1119280.1 hypothetical protein [Anaerolineae bacterium]
MFAAPAMQETASVSRMVKSITLEMGADTGAPTVVMILTNKLEVTETIRLSVFDAAIGLIIYFIVWRIVVNSGSKNLLNISSRKPV